MRLSPTARARRRRLSGRRRRDRQPGKAPPASIRRHHRRARAEAPAPRRRPACRRMAARQAMPEPAAPAQLRPNAADAGDDVGGSSASPPWRWRSRESRRMRRRRPAPSTGCSAAPFGKRRSAAASSAGRLEHCKPGRRPGRRRAAGRRDAGASAAGSPPRRARRLPMLTAGDEGRSRRLSRRPEAGRRNRSSPSSAETAT